MEEEKPTTSTEKKRMFLWKKKNPPHSTEKSVLWSFKVSTNLCHSAPGERGLRAYTLHAFTKSLMPADIIKMKKILK